MKIFVSLLFLLSFGSVLSQDVHTVFTDSIKLIKDGDTILWKEHRKTFFINSTRDTTIELYHDSNLTIKRTIRFPKLKKVTVYDSNNQKLGKREYGLYQSISNKVIIDGKSESFGRTYHIMDMIDDHTDGITEQWFKYEDEYKTDCVLFVEIQYESIKGAPINRTNYPHTQKEGQWEFAYYGKYMISTFENNLKSGIEITYQRNKLKIENFYEKGEMIRVKVFDMKRERYLSDPL